MAWYVKDGEGEKVGLNETQKVPVDRHEWVGETSYLWTKAFCESLHATEGGAELNTTAVQKDA